jgi:molybdenum cofactor guanylyltransferase
VVIVGLALAGGRSRRFGAEKAVAMVEGSTMLERTLSRLRPASDTLAVSARSGSAAAALAERLELPVLLDREGDPEGPLAGIRAGLAWAQGLSAARLLIAPCDTPFLPMDYALRMLTSDPERPAVAVVAGELEPLCSVWPVRLLSNIEDVLAGGHPSVGALLTQLGATEVRFDDLQAFRNVNRREDLDPR